MKNKLIFIILGIIFLIGIVSAETTNVGLPAINRVDSFSAGNTLINNNSCAASSFTLNNINVYLSSVSATNLKVGVFNGSGTKWQVRSYVNLGFVTFGSNKSFTTDNNSNPISISVQTGDCIGMYDITGDIERDTTGYDGTIYKGGDQFDAGSQSGYNYATYSISGMSLWGSGTIISNSVTLISPISPANNSLITLTGVNFTINSNSTSVYNLTNITYNIWFNNGTLFNQTIVGITGTSNQTTLFIDDFILASYLWGGTSCSGNGNGTNCTSSSNYSFIIGGSLNAQGYSAFVYETQFINFTANISLLSGAIIYDKSLWYNGIAYSSFSSNLGSDQYTFWQTIDIPLINTSSINRSFFWAITFQRPDGSFFFQNFTSAQQNISQITLTNCSSGSITLNFTTWNEESLVQLAPYEFFGTFDYWLGSGIITKNLSLTNHDINQTKLCITPGDLTYYSNAKIQYEKTDYIKRSHYFVNATLTNTTNHIKLFLLNSLKSTSFIIDVIDQAQLAVPNVLINIQRYYPGSGIFETMEMGLTDSQGSTIGHFETETEDYKVLIYRNSTLLFESGVQKIFCRDTPCTLTFQIGSVPVAQWQNFGNLSNVVWNLDYNKTTKIWTYNYLDTSGTSQLGRLYVYTEGGAGRTTICNTNSSSTAASLTCNVSAYTGAIYAKALLTYGGNEVLVYLDSVVLESAKNIFGFEGLFLSGLVLLVLATAGLWNPAVGIILVVVGMILLNFIGLATFGAVMMWAVIFIALLLLWSLKT